MPIGNLDSRGKRADYRIVGEHPSAEGDNLEQALIDLFTFQWTVANNPSLAMHKPGNVRIQLRVGTTEIEFEITDRKLLEEAQHDPSKLVAYVASKMGIDKADAEQILSQSRATVTIDTIYWRDLVKQTIWRPEPGRDLDEVFPKNTLVLIKKLTEEEDLYRAARRIRTPQGRRLLDTAVRLGKERGWTYKEMAKQTGFPRSTLRDAFVRMERQKIVRAEFSERKVGQRLTVDQKATIVSELQVESGNAAAVARKLGVPARTVRDLKSRSSRPTPRARTHRRYTQSDRDALIDIVRTQQLTPTEAGRTMGVPDRTARQWVQRAREKLSED